MGQSTFKLLYSDSFQSSGLTREVAKVTQYLEKGDFQGIEVNKLSPGPYYRVKLNNTNHLLFKPLKYQEETQFLLLEVVDGNAYKNSRFLRGITEPIQPELIVSPEGLQAANKRRQWQSSLFRPFYRV